MSKCGKVNIFSPLLLFLLRPWLNLELKMHAILNFRSLERAVNKYEIECLLKRRSRGRESNGGAWEGWAGDQSGLSSQTRVRLQEHLCEHRVRERD